MSKKSYICKPRSVHPGRTLRSKIDEMDISIQNLSKQTGLDEFVLNDILSGEGEINEDIALKLEKVLKIPASFWLRYQKGFNNNKK